MITLEEGVKLVWKAFYDMLGGEIYVKKIPSMSIGDIATAVDSEAKQVVIGIRPGEKIHEQMIGVEDAPHTFEYDGYYKILPAIHSWSSDPLRIEEGKSVPVDFTYSSDNNSEWMTVDELKAWIDTNKSKIGQI
jgi:FlaA1/EpsC-like NDP-sugar epimerase